MSHLERAVRAIRVGDPLDERTQMGPLISSSQRDTVASFIDGDAPVAIRGSAPERPATGSRRRCSARSTRGPGSRARRCSARWPP